ncbi:MAG: hypothetical protein M1833_005025 [Piccolia ochrophora]|nr:MAG: hypothetical protein M1833_005025 [Piccolia ochrophora]
MRIRAPFAGGFLVLVLLSAYVGLAKVQIPQTNDKVLHFVDFFLLTLCFYWVLDTSRRRSLNFTLTVCTVCLGIGSEFLQALLPNNRLFDPYDIAANLLGSLSALGLCSWYHKRMLERKRLAKQYHVVPGEDDDVELGGDIGSPAAQETGITAGPPGRSLDDEVDNWDENAMDNWEEDEEEPAGTGTESGDGEGQKTPESGSAPEVDGKQEERRSTG